jgi:photosystem II stability/assembly factor-like uncharacterized protein
VTLIPTTPREHSTTQRPAELLIKEARQRTRRRRAAVVTVVVVVAVLAMAVATFGPFQTSGPRVNGGGKNPRSVTLAPGTNVTASSVVGLKMFTVATGLAINTAWNSSGQMATHSYLTATTNGGSEWSVVSSLPEVIASPLLAFANSRVGYVAGFQEANSLLATNNGGLTWSRIHVEGLPTSVTVSGGVVWVTADRCPRGIIAGSSVNCRTYLVAIKYGARALTSVRQIPSIDPALRAVLPNSVSAWTARLIARTGPSSALVVEGTDGPNSLLLTADAGRTWHQIANPCAGIPVASAAAINGARWYALCSQAAGMSHATNELFETFNSGETWTLLAESHVMGPNRGNLDGLVAGTFGANTSGQILWLTDSLGFVSVSIDGGQTWRQVNRNLIQYTEQPFVSIGNAAWLANYHGGLIRTTDGIHWDLVRRSPLGN